ncbi:MAG: hypothetical protein IT437_13365 [Phycisphaerales bacterium]|nr:hypothetical protein [Phycisphaerales bacterium]
MHTRTAQPAAPHRPVRVEGPREVTVQWTVARAALGPRVGAQGPGDVTLELAATPSPDGWVCRACLLDGRTSVPLELPPVGRAVPGWVSDPEGGLDHLDLPGFLHATLRGAAVVYARTPLLALLPVPGGRYEVHRPEVHPSA